MTIYTDSGDNTSAKRVQRIRDVADGVTVASISDESILEKLEKSDRWGETITNKFDWVEADKKWQTFLEMNENRTASKIPGILKETHDDLKEDYRTTSKALNRKDSEIQKTGISPIAEGVNITNELDPDNYIPEQDVFS